jgi:hypothetical protein
MKPLPICREVKGEGGVISDERDCGENSQRLMRAGEGGVGNYPWDPGKTLKLSQ